VIKRSEPFVGEFVHNGNYTLFPMRISELRSMLGNPAVRVPVTIALLMVVAAVLVLTCSYRNQLEQYKQGELTRLNAIAVTLVEQLDADAIEDLLHRHPQRDQIFKSTDDAVYERAHHALRTAQEKNGIVTDIYTLHFEGDQLYFGVTSGERPYYRHHWVTETADYVNAYTTGSTIGPYVDEQGTWLSAFVPIQNSNGKTISVLQVDEQFDSFIDRVHTVVFRELLIVLGIFIIVIVLLSRNVRLAMRKEELFKRRLEYHNRLIEQKNKDIIDSLHSAKAIQKSLLPGADLISKCFKHNALVFMPRDIVSGDFFWLHETDRFIYVAVADCTGHGVPGALMSMIGQTTLNDIIALSPSLHCDELLCELNARVNKLVRHGSADGMDIGLCRFEKGSTKIQFAGANQMIYISGRDTSHFIRGDRQGINGHLNPEHSFTMHTIELKAGDNVYLFSDGFQDQFGGEKGKKFMRKQLFTLLDKISSFNMSEQETIIKHTFQEWRGTRDQVDDVLIWGIQIA
jgi:serine phosphatase RsbU (regulator of sigma subunit)